MAIAAADMQIVICGGGIIGAACAYYLSGLGVRHITIVERAAVACHSSGKAGGFLAKGWGSELMDASYDLHAELGKTLEGTDYRTVETLQVAMGGAGGGVLPNWADRCTATGRMGTHETTAQVHPRKLTEALVAAAQKRGTRLKIGVVEGIATTEEGRKVSGVRVDGKVLACDSVIISMGPWSAIAADWFPRSVPRGISGQKYTSIVVPTAANETSATCLFTNSSEHVELYPRHDEVYACGCPEMTPLPEDPTTIVANPASVNAIGEVVSACSSGLSAKLDTAHTQGCYLPTSPDGEPLIGAVPGVSGAYIATGHSCWGILNAPATGLGIAELIVAGKTSSVNLAPYDPQRFVR